MPDPCGVPTSTGSHRPLSRTPALSHRSIKRRIRGSAILCPSIRTSHPWSTESKKVRMSRSSTQLTRCVIRAFSKAAKARLWAASRPEAVAEAQEVGLVDGVQYLGHRTLDNLILERGNAERPAAAVTF